MDGVVDELLGADESPADAPVPCETDEGADEPDEVFAADVLLAGELFDSGSISARKGSVLYSQDVSAEFKVMRKNW